MQRMHKRPHPALCQLFIRSALAVLVAAACHTQAAQFNPRFLEDVGTGSALADLSIYEGATGKQLPGNYRVEIIVNERKHEVRELAFSAATAAQQAAGESLTPCLSRVQLAEMGVRVGSFPALEAYPAEACAPFTELIPNAASHFDFNTQTLILSFPQAAMVQTARGTVPESRWDEGIPALLMDYSFSGSNGRTDTDYQENHYTDEWGREHDDSSGGRSYSNGYYFNLRSGVNLGAWRLRNNSTWSRYDGQTSTDNLGTYLTRNIVPLKADLTLGDTYTAADVFDSVQFRGVQLTSDDEMLPDSQRGFAPVVRGIARTNAEVVIEQNGYVIYRTFVQPGAFEITDLYPTSSSGDLTVTVKESDGREQRFIQPFAAVSILLREGQLKYSVSGGEYQGGNYESGNPQFVQGHAIYGLPHGITAYGGTLFSEDYNALALGAGINLGDIGAISLDVTQAKSDLGDGRDEQGQSYRFLYAKSFADSGTDFRLLGYRYSTQGYYSFQEATDVRNHADSDYARYHQRSQLQGNITQQMGRYGSVYFSMNLQDYWGDDDTQRSVSGGYNGRIGAVSWGMAYSYTRSPDYDDADHLFSFNVSVPLGQAWSSYRMTSDLHGRTNHQVGLSGTALEQRNLNWSVQEGYGSDGVGNSGNASLGYQGSKGNIDLGYNYSRDSNQVNYGLRGGVIVHSQGVTLSQPLSESMILVNAPGAAGTSVSNNSGVALDHFGNAVIPYATPYRETEVSLRTDTLGDNVDLSEPIQYVVPTRGAVVRAQFTTQVGYRAMVNLSRADGSAVPFGAAATLVQKENVKTPQSGIVGEAGQLYMSGLPEKGTLMVSWGKEAGQQCSAPYQVPPLGAEPVAVVTLTAQCR